MSRYPRVFGSPAARKQARAAWAATHSANPIVSANARIAFVGDSITQQAVSLQAPPYPAPFDTRAFITHLRQRALGTLDIDWKHIFALSGTRTEQQIASGYHTQAAASDAGAVVVLTGVNNPNSTNYTAQTDGGLSKYQGEMQAIISTLRAAGKIVVIGDGIPSTATSSGTLVQAQKNYIRTLHNPAGGVYVWNVFNVLAATADALGYKSGYSVDDLHPIVKGAIPMAQSLLDVILPIVPAYQVLNRAGSIQPALAATTGTTPPTGWTASAATFGTMTHSTYTDGNGDFIWDVTITGATDTTGSAITTITGPANTALLAANGGPLVPGTSVLESAAAVSIVEGWSNFRNVLHTLYMTGGTSAKADGATTWTPGGAGSAASAGGNMTDGQDGGSANQYDYGPVQGAQANLVLRTHPATLIASPTKVQQVFSIYSRINLAATFTVRINMSKLRMWAA